MLYIYDDPGGLTLIFFHDKANFGPLRLSTFS